MMSSGIEDNIYVGGEGGELLIEWNEFDPRSSQILHYKLAGSIH